MNSTNRVSSEQGAIILQYLARALFAVLAVIYFHHTPSSSSRCRKAPPG